MTDMAGARFARAAHARLLPLFFYFVVDKRMLLVYNAACGLESASVDRLLWGMV